MTDNNRNDDGEFTATEDVTEHRDLFDAYSGWLAGHTDNTRTVTRRKAGSKHWLLWCENTGTDPLSAVPDDVRDWLKEQKADGLAGTTISSRFASVSKFYRWVLTDSDSESTIDENPTEEVDPARYDIYNSAEYINVVHRQGRQNIIAPSRSEVEKLFDVSIGRTDFVRVRNELICRLLWQTALRGDELSRVRFDNVDLDDRAITVRSAKLDREAHPDLYHRQTFYEENLDYLLHRYIDMREEKANDNNPHLIVGNRGGQLKAPTISRIVKDTAHEAGIQEPLTTNSDGSVKQWLYTAHRLRHARITYLANKTELDLNFIRMIAGHAKISTTLGYVNADWDEAQKAFHSATGST